MRIAFFTDTFHPQINGVTNTLSRLAQYLKKHNIPHIFLAPEYPGETEPMNDIPILRFRSVLFPPYPECRLALPLYANLKRQVDAFQPDLIHIVTPLGIGQAGVRYAKDHNIPLVASFHTNFDAYLKYYGLQTLEPVLWRFLRNFHKDFQINFCPSSDTKKTLEKQGFQSLKIWTRGIDTSEFSPAYRSGSTTSEKLKILYAGRIAVEKDLHILLEAMPILNRKYKDLIEFVIVGDGPFMNPMQDKAPDNVRFMGYLKGEALAQAYASCDIFAFPSSTETLGNVVLEAMASGLPVVGVHSGGVTDNILHNENGLLAKPCDAESFAFMLEQVIVNPSLRLRLRANALEYAAKKSWDHVFANLIEDYKSLDTSGGKNSRYIA